MAEDADDQQLMAGSPCDEIDPAELFENQGGVEVDRNPADDRGSGSEFDSEREEHVDLSSENELSDGFPYGITPPRNVRRQKEKAKRDKEKVQGFLKSPLAREYATHASDRAELDRRKKRGSTQLTTERAYQRKLKRGSVDVGFVSVEGGAHVADTSKSLEIPSIKIESTSRFMSLDCVCEDSTDGASANTNTNTSFVRTKSISIKGTTPRSHRRATRSESDPRSSTSRNYLNPYCPEARMEFYRTFSLLIKLGSLAHKQQERQYGTDGSALERQSSEENKKYQVELSQALWLELQAWHANRTMWEQDLYLIRARANVEEVLNEVINFKVKKQDVNNQVLNEKVDQNSQDGNGNRDLSNKTDNKEFIFTHADSGSGTYAQLTCPVNSVIHNSSESNQTEQFDSLKSQKTGGFSVETSQQFLSETDSFVNGPTPNDYRALKGRLCLDLSQRNQKLHPGEAGFKPGRETLPDRTCCQLKAAIEQVTELFDKVEHIENLYPTRQSLGEQNPKYTSKEFTRNFETMCLWLNVTSELYHKLHLIAKFVGVNTAEVETWHDWLDVGLGRLGIIFIRLYFSEE